MNILWTEEEILADKREILGWVPPEQRGKVLNLLEAHYRAVRQAREALEEVLRGEIGFDRAKTLCAKINGWADPTQGVGHVMDVLRKEGAS